MDQTRQSPALPTLLLVLLFTFLISACTDHKAGTPATGSAEAQGALCPLQIPATFTGVLPCRGCAGLKMSITLRPDSVYLLRETRLDDRGEGIKKVAEMGRWRYVPDSNSIVFGRRKDAVRVLTISSPEILRLEGRHGSKNTDKANRDLVREEKVDPFPDPVLIKGMYRHKAGAGSISECASGAVFPVADGRGRTALQQAYLDTPHGQDEALLVTLEGRFVRTAGKKESIAVDRFIAFHPDRDCSGSRDRISLINTTWRLVEVEGKPVSTEEGQREPFFVLDANGNQRGFSGCNRFFGTYLVRGDIFLFNKMASTRMACRKAMDTEDAFLRALSATESYMIRENILELRDRRGTVLARLKAAAN